MRMHTRWYCSSCRLTAVENCLSHTLSLYNINLHRVSNCVWDDQMCVWAGCVPTCVSVYIYERWSQREHCKFSLAITLRRVMLRSPQSANQKILTHSILWMRRHVCEVHTHTRSENTLQWCNTITQSSRSACKTNAVRAESEQFDNV